MESSMSRVWDWEPCCDVGDDAVSVYAKRERERVLRRGVVAWCSSSSSLAVPLDCLEDRIILAVRACGLAGENLCD